jgi:hypothetical protein
MGQSSPGRYEQLGESVPQTRPSGDEAYVEKTRPAAKNQVRGQGNASKFAPLREENNTAQNIKFMCFVTKPITDSDQGDLDAFALSSKAPWSHSAKKSVESFENCSLLHFVQPLATILVAHLAAYCEHLPGLFLILGNSLAFPIIVSENAARLGQAAVA